MVNPKPIYSLVILVLASFVKCDFTPLGDWLLYRPDWVNPVADIKNQKNSGIPSIASTTGVSLNDNIDCYSLFIAFQVWSLKTDYTSLIAGLDEFTVGFWLRYLSPSSAKNFQFGSDTGPHYDVSTGLTGFDISFYKNDITKDGNNDFSIPVPFPVWFFIAFHFVNDGGTVTLNVLISGKGKFSKTNVLGSTVPFQMPNGNLVFGFDAFAKFYEIILTSGAKISDDFNTITLKDSSNTEFDIAKSCGADACYDTFCHGDGSCLSSKELCFDCSGGTCARCGNDGEINGRDINTYCQTCLTGFTLKKGFCCRTERNCATCIKSPDICGSCPADSFFYEENETSLSCISCTDSCSDCLPGPFCFECADSILQEGNTCNVEKIGFQVSFEAPNIVIDFAYPLSFDLEKSSFKAKSSENTDIITDHWKFVDCILGSKQCVIETDNVKESDLPISLDIEFDKVEPSDD